MTNRPVSTTSSNVCGTQVLVTGANGLTGHGVVKALLDRGYRVRAMVQPGTDLRNLDGMGVERVEGDLLDPPSLRRALEGVKVLHHVAAIFDFAANPATDPARYAADCARLYRNNVEGTTAIMLAAQQARVERIVYTSTMACIGVGPARAMSHAPGSVLLDETMPFDIWLPLNDYMRSKGFAEAVVMQFVKAGAPVVIVNPTWTVGPGDVSLTPVGQVVFDVMNGREPKVTPAGINIVDVDDVGMGHVLAQEKGRIGERYILGGENVECDDLLNTIRRAAGLPEQTAGAEVPSSFPRDFLWYDSTKARTELGWSSRPLAETVERAVEWFRRNR